MSVLGVMLFFLKDFLSQRKNIFSVGIIKSILYSLIRLLKLMDNERVHIIPQQNLGWPDTLLRYHMFQGICDLLVPFDYCCFFNSNAEFCSPVGAEFLPTDNKMLFVQHPDFILHLLITSPMIVILNLVHMFLLEKGPFMFAEV